MSRIVFGLFFFGIAATSFLTYGPSLNQPFVDPDQIRYLAEREVAPSLWDGLAQYDYVASRRFWKGDDFIFQPLLNIWLALQYPLFTYHFYSWNLAHLVLHVLVMTALGLLLWKIQKGIFAVFLTLAVSSSRGASSLVLFHHAGGYLWSFILLLPALGILWEMVCARKISKGQMLGYVVLTTLACFFYDVLFVLSIPMAAYVLFLGLRRKTFSAQHFLFLLPPLIYVLFYLGHLQGVPRPFFVDRDDGISNLFQASNFIQWPHRFLWVVYQWTLGVLSPNFSKSALALGVLGILLGILVLSRGMSKTHFTKYYPFPLLIFCLIVTFIGTITFVRHISRGGVYVYFFCIFVTLLVYSCLDFSRVRGRKWVLASTLLLLLIPANVFSTARYVQRVTANYAEMSSYHSFLSHFVDRGKKEKGFSFVVDSPDEEVDPWVKLKEGYPDDKEASVTRKRLSEILYAPYVTPRNPKHVLRWNGNAFEEIASR